MTYEEIIKHHNEGKVFAGTMREDATDFDVLVFKNEAAARAYCLKQFESEDDIKVTGIAWTDMEVTDPNGYYSGSGRRYSLIPMMYPETEITE